MAQLSPEMWAVARRTVESEHFFSSNDILRTHAAKVVAQAVLEHENDAQLASTVVQNIRLAIEGGVWGDESLKRVMVFIASRHPDVFLSEVMSDGRAGDVRWYFFTDNDDSDVRASGHPIDRIDPALLLEWVHADPGARARQVAQVLTFSVRSTGSEEINWTQPALDLIAIKETALEVLGEFERRFYVGSWTGSEAHRYARRRPLCEALQDHRNPSVRRWAREALWRLEDAIRSAEDRERGESQSFE